VVARPRLGYGILKAHQYLAAGSLMCDLVESIWFNSIYYRNKA
jgi:hypothetical protein